jgi:hypothetical protein
MTSHRVVSDYTRAEGDVPSNIKVFVRVRPPDEQVGNGPIDENKEGSFKSCLVLDEEDPRRVTVKDPDSSNKRYGEVAFQFDNILWTEATQKEVFEATCKGQVDSIIEGYKYVTNPLRIGPLLSMHFCFVYIAVVLCVLDFVCVSLMLLCCAALRGSRYVCCFALSLR